MASENTQETKTIVQSQPNNPKVQQTIDQLLGGVQSVYGKGASAFPESKYAGVGPTTLNAWSMGKNAAGNPQYTTAINDAMGYAGDLAGGSGPSLTEQTLGDVAAGKYLDNTDPNFMAMLDRITNGTRADINASLGADGAYGSNIHVGALADELGGLRTRALADNRAFEIGRQQQALGAIEGTRQQGVANTFAAQNQLPQLLAGGQLPASYMGAIGAAEDADRQAALMGRSDLWERQYNSQSDLLAKLSAILSGNAAAGGQTSTQTSIEPATPWWQTAAGLGLGAAGLFL